MAAPHTRTGLVDALLAAPDASAVRAALRSAAGPVDLRALHMVERRFRRARTRDLTVAERCAVAAEAIAANLEDPEAEGIAARIRGVVDHVLGRPDSARRHLGRAVRLARSAGDRVGEGDLHRVLIDVHVAAGDPRAAVVAHAAARSAYRSAGGVDRLRLGSLAMNRGNLFHLQDDYRAALRSYAAARDHFRQAGDVRRLAAVEFNRGNILASTDRLGDSRRAYASARRVFMRAGDRTAAAKVDRALAELDRLEGRWDHCLERLDATRAVRDAQGDRAGLAHTDLERARALLALNRLAEAEEASDDARAAFEAAGQPLQAAQARGVRAEIELVRGRPEGALPLLDGARAIFRRRGNPVAAARFALMEARARAMSGDVPTARRLARGARSAFERARLTSARGHANAVLALVEERAGRPRAARPAAERALRAARSLRDARTEFEMQLLLGRLHESRGRHAPAYRRYVAAEACVERMRRGVRTEASKLAFAQDKSEVYERLIINRLEKGDAAALRSAVTFAERGKARALVDALQRLPGDLRSERGERAARAIEKLRRVESELHRAERRLEEDSTRPGLRAAIPARLRRLNDERGAALQRLQRLDPGRALLEGAVPPEPWSFLDSMERDEIVLSFARTGDTFHLFAIERDRVRAFPRIAAVADVEKTIELLRFQLGKGVYGDEHFRRFGALYERVVGGYLGDLADRLLAPVWDELAGRRVHVVPHEILHGLPFHALERGGQALVDRSVVSYAPSIATLASLRRRRPEATGRPVILGVADRNAPAIAEEVRAISHRLHDADLLEGAEATSAAIRSLPERPRILHIACHAAYRSADPWSAALRLGDAWVSLAELYDLGRTGEVVVLSGCTTGLGTVYSGDEWVGLVRGFFRAGARTVLASLWEVHDRTAVRLMKRFYDAYAAGGSVADALTAAQRCARAEGTPALHWAAFMTVGDPSPQWTAREAA